MKAGWCWQIPIDAERTSVGLVCLKEDFLASQQTPEIYFSNRLGQAEVLSSKISGATPLEESYNVTSDYSYSYESFAGDSYFFGGRCGVLYRSDIFFRSLRGGWSPGLWRRKP